jgi:hypothetical protein
VLGFSFAAPIPPLTFLDGKMRVARLGYSGLEGVEDAGILVLASEAFEAGIELAGVAFGKLGNRADAEKVEIAFDGRADGEEIAELAWVSHGSPFLISLYFRHRLRQNLAHLW